jgi:hypothetical protein
MLQDSRVITKRGELLHLSSQSDRVTAEARIAGSRPPGGAVDMAGRAPRGSGTATRLILPNPKVT